MRFKSGRFVVGTVLVAGIIVSFATDLRAEKIQPYKLTRLDGLFAMRYFSDEQSYTRNEDTSAIDSDIKELEINVQTQSYVYHPKFLKIQMGGGPILVSNSQQSNTVDELTYNLNTRFSFFEKKVYPFSFFYEYRNPLVVPALGDHFLQENTKYGSTAIYRDKSLPVSISAEAYKLTSKGEGTYQVVDDDVSSINLRVFQNNKKNGYRQFVLQSSKNSSHSGNIGANTQTINGSKISAISANYDSYSLLGDRSQYTFKDTFSYIDRDFTQELVSTNVNLSQLQYNSFLQWFHTKTLHTFYQFDYFDSKQNDIFTKNRLVSAGYSRTANGAGSHSASANVSRNSTSGFKINNYGVSGSADFAKAIGAQHDTKQNKDVGVPIWNVKLQVGVGYQVFDREADNASRSVVVQDERYVLAGTSDVKLNNEVVDANTIEVFNLAKTQSYIRGIDYAVIEIGNSVYIRRLLGGNIADNEEVLVSYQYKTGGTFSNTTTDQQIQLTADLSNRLNIFYGITKKGIDITSGTPGIELKSTENRTMGSVLNYPVNESLILGADTRLDKQTKGISPYDRKTVSASLQLRLFETTLLRASVQKLKTTYVDELEDVDLKRYNVWLSAQPYRRITMSLSMVDEEDTGGMYPRELKDFALKLRWHYRKLYLTVSANRNQETQYAGSGDKVSRDRKLFRAILERRF